MDAKQVVPPDAVAAKTVCLVRLSASAMTKIATM